MNNKKVMTENYKVIPFDSLSAALNNHQVRF